MNSIRDIQGIGEKTALRLIAHFGSEEAVMQNFLRHDVAAIANVPGIGEKNAISLVQRYIFREEQITPSDFLKTEEAWRVYRELLQIIKSYANTDYGREKLSIYFPMPSSKRDRIVSITDSVSEACGMVNEIASFEQGTAGMRNALKGIKPIVDVKPDKVRDRAIIAAGHKEYQQALSRFGSAVNVILIESPRELVDAAASYHQVIASRDMEGVDLPFDAGVEFADLAALRTWEAVPESEIAFFARNLGTISSAIQAFKQAGEPGLQYFSGIDAASIGSLESALAGMDKEGICSDTEIDRIQSALDGLEGSIKNAEAGANKQFKEYLESSTVTLSSKDLLDAAEGRMKHLLEKEMAGRYRDIIRQHISDIAAELGLDAREALLLDDLFAADIRSSIQADQETVKHLRQILSGRLTKRQLQLQRGTARVLSGQKENSRKLVSSAMELDLWFSIGLFALESGMVPPLLHAGAGVEIRGGKNLFLKGDIEPVDYALGERSQDSRVDGYSPSRVAVLSGVNSGGKTSMLDLVAQTFILAHMGFPVPADQARVGLIDELYYFGKSSGTMDAGAFESTIRAFSVVSGRGKMAVLVDELESITEPGASARIIAGILESLQENPQSTGLFVSHLAEGIMEHTSGNVRVDGIEAKGLDDDLNLIVDRNPRYNYVAKSTPELIVEKLARQAEGAKQKFYQRLLGKFR